MTTTTTSTSHRQTVTTLSPGTPTVTRSYRAAERAALTAAKASEPGWRHYAPYGICYTVESDGRITRSHHDDSGIPIGVDRIVGRVQS